MSVSILSRPEGREQRSAICRITRSSLFQSSLAPKGESNVRRLGTSRLWPSFNPLSPRRARATKRLTIVKPLITVSILSRPEGREQRGESRGGCRWYGFNPLSPRRARATIHKRCKTHQHHRFNPLSPRRARATISWVNNAPTPPVSILSRPEGREQLY